MIIFRNKEGREAGKKENNSGELQFRKHKNNEDVGRRDDRTKLKWMRICVHCYV